MLLLIDTTCLSAGWVVLQVSLPFQRRALPLYRVVYPYAGADRDQLRALGAALAWLAPHLPGPRRRCVARIKGNGRVACPEFTGLIREAPLVRDPVPEPALSGDALLGWRDPRERGPEWRGVAQVVRCHALGQKEPWWLVTHLSCAWEAVRVYAERMPIEQECRDLKGPCGLDRLADWTDADRVARRRVWLARQVRLSGRLAIDRL